MKSTRTSVMRAMNALPFVILLCATAAFAQREEDAPGGADAGDQPVFVQIDVNLKKDARLYYDGATFFSFSSENTNNKIPNNGELLAFELSVTNKSERTLISTSAFVNATSEVVTIVGLERKYILPKQFVKGQTWTTSFYGYVHQDATHGTPFPITVLVGDSAAGTNEQDFLFQVQKPASHPRVGPLYASNIHVDDDVFGDSDGNGNGIPEPGETIEIQFEVRNDGDLDMERVEIKVEAPEWLTFENSTYSVGTIPAKSKRPMLIDFEATVARQLNVDEIPLAIVIAGTDMLQRAHHWSFKTYLSTRDVEVRQELDSASYKEPYFRQSLLENLVKNYQRKVTFEQKIFAFLFEGRPESIPEAELGYYFDLGIKGERDNDVVKNARLGKLRLITPNHDLPVHVEGDQVTVEGFSTFSLNLGYFEPHFVRVGENQYCYYMRSNLDPVKKIAIELSPKSVTIRRLW